MKKSFDEAHSSAITHISNLWKTIQTDCSESDRLLFLISFLEKAVGGMQKAYEDLAASHRTRTIKDVRIQQAIEMAVRYGAIEGDHHKSWVIDQMVRRLAGSRYDDVVREARAGEDGPETYDWYEGIPP